MFLFSKPYFVTDFPVNGRKVQDDALASRMSDGRSAFLHFDYLLATHKNLKQCVIPDITPENCVTLNVYQIQDESTGQWFRKIGTAEEDTVEESLRGHIWACKRQANAALAKINSGKPVLVGREGVLLVRMLTPSKIDLTLRNQTGQYREYDQKKHDEFRAKIVGYIYVDIRQSPKSVKYAFVHDKWIQSGEAEYSPAEGEGHMQHLDSCLPNVLTDPLP